MLPTRALRTSTLLIPAALAIALAQGAWGQEGGEGQPFADADMKPSVQARCEEVRRLTQGVETGEKRIDFSVVGALTLVQFDGVLAYLGLCAAPDPKVLCVTYQTNGLKVGDVVAVAGGYSRPDADHILLDPCLASEPRQPAP